MAKVKTNKGATKTGQQLAGDKLQYSYNVKSLGQALKGKPGDYAVKSSKMSYLIISIGSTGASIKYYRWIDGVARRTTLGKLKPLTQDVLDCIGVNWVKANALAEKGQNPNSWKGRTAAATTNGNNATKGTLEWALRQHEAKGAIDNRERSKKERWDYMDRFAPDWLPRRVSSITTEEIETRHAKIGAEKGKPTANRFLSFNSGADEST